MADDILTSELKKKKISFSDTLTSNSNYKLLKKLILKELNNKIKAIDFIEKHFNLNQKGLFITSTSTVFNINNLKSNVISNVINLMKLNDARYVNKLIEAINRKHP